MATGNAYGLLWHLDRLAQQRPDDWRLAASRGTALADSEAFDAAETAFALAAQHGAGEALVDWYSHGAAMASSARSHWAKSPCTSVRCAAPSLLGFFAGSRNSSPSAISSCRSPAR